MAYARRLRELMHPEGRLFIGTTGTATSTLSRRVLLAGRRGSSCSSRDTSVRRRVAATVPGTGPLIQAEHPVVVDDVLRLL